MAHFLGTPTRSHLWWTSPRNGLDTEDAKKLQKRLLSGPLVDVFVGPERKHWSLHRNLLCYHSSFLQTEFEGHEVPRVMKEDGNKLELPDDDPIAFELLVKWIYQGQLEGCLEGSDEQKYEHALACYKLYLLCEKLDMIKLKNQSMDMYRQGLHESALVPDATELWDIYRTAPAGSPFRKLMTRIAARQIMDNAVEKDASTYRKCFENSADFGIEMVNAIRSMSGGMLFDDPTKASDACQYHDHRDGSGCPPRATVAVKNNTDKQPVRNEKGTCYLTAIAANDANSHPTVKKSPAVKQQPPQPQLLVELSAEKRTPRKLEIRQPDTPTPKAAKRPSNQLNVNSPVRHRQASSPLRTFTLPGGATNGLRDADTASQTSSGSVLGKRRTVHITPKSVANGRPPVSKGQRQRGTVNGMVQHLDGGLRRTVSEGSQSPDRGRASPSPNTPVRQPKRQANGTGT